MIKFTIKPDDADEYHVEATSRDVLVWEKTSREHKTFQDLVRTQAMVDLYRIAHIASVRLGLFTGDLPTFEKTCELEQMEDEGEGVDPTRSAQ